MADNTLDRDEKYKSYRFVDGVAKWVILNEKGEIIDKNPNKDQLKLAKTFRYNPANACDICGEDLYNKNHAREYDKEGKITGRWLCQKCYQRYDPNSNNNLRKSLRDHRTGNLDPSSTHAIGDKFQKLTCQWLGVRDLNVENDNFEMPIDHSRHQLYGIIQTKGKLYDPINRYWIIRLDNEHTKDFDNLIVYCADQKGKNIERIYIFPKEEIIKRCSVTIVKNPSKGTQWYEKYRQDENAVVYVNKIFKNLK